MELWRWGMVVVLMIATTVPLVRPAKILALCTVPSPSHSLWCYKFMETLVQRGHQVTVFGVDEPKWKIANLTTFIAEGVYEAIHVPELTSETLTDGSDLNILSKFITIQDQLASPAMLKSDALHSLLKTYKHIKKPFDLIIHDHLVCFACVGLVHHFDDPPLVLATVYSSPQMWMIGVGNSPSPVYIPNTILPYDQHMTFYERCVNLLFYLHTIYVYQYKMGSYQEKLIKEVFGDDVPSVSDIVKRANIIMVNYNLALDGPRPLLPGVVPVPGLHVSEPRPLPQELKDFVKEAKDGVVLLSFGSNIDASWLPKNMESILMEAFRGLPQRVLWKWERSPPGLPSNMRTSTWLPQNDILADSNVRLFVSHCGLLSSQEAVVRSVPVLALPVFLDQHVNADKLRRRGCSLTLDITTVSADQLRKTVLEMLHNPKYAKNMAMISKLMSDAPQTPREQAVFWTEYAIRHQGAAHLRAAAADMPWHQLLLLDVIAVVLFLLCTSVWLVKTVTKFLFSQIKYARSTNKCKKQ